MARFPGNEPGSGTTPRLTSSVLKSSVSEQHRHIPQVTRPLRSHFTRPSLPGAPPAGQQGRGRSGPRCLL